MIKKQIKILFVALFLLILFFLSQNISALVPPIVDSSIPENGGNLLGDTVRFYGYSLSYADTEELIVIDLTTDNEVETSLDLICESEGEGDAPGCVQSKCILAITLIENTPMHEYEISLIDSNITLPWTTFQFFGSAADMGEDIDLDGITDKQGDCNDNDPEIYPGAVERCSDDVDRDCDGYHTVCCESDGVGGCFILLAQLS